MKSKSKIQATILTLAANMFNSVILILFNMVYTKMLLKTYGSEVNGLISTITQFVSFFSIVEGGFTTAAIVATYEPIYTKDFQKVRSILYTVKRELEKIALTIGITVLVVGGLYICIVDSPLEFVKTYFLLIISALTTTFSIGGMSKYSVFFQGYNKEYVLSIYTMFSKTFTWCISLILIQKSCDICWVFLCNFYNVLCNMFLARVYIKKHHSEISFIGSYDKKLIKGTNDVFFQKIASTVFNYTDLILVSACISFSAASVYNLYNMIFRSISSVLTSIILAPFNSFGQLMNERDEQKSMEVFKIYFKITLVLTTALLGITVITIIPFIRVYVKDINDYNYIHPILAILFLSYYFVITINKPFGLILNVTGNFKRQNRQCFWSVIINIVVSVVFIKWLGMYSIVFGSVIAALFVLELNMWETQKEIFNYSMKKSNIYILVNFFLSIFVSIIARSHAVKIENYIFWTVYALCWSGIILVLVILLNYLVDYNGMMSVLQYVKNMEKIKKLFPKDKREG